MTGHFQSKHSIGDRILWHGLKATISEVRFDVRHVLYELMFDAGGATAVVDEREIRKVA